MNLKKQFLLISLILLTWACDSGNSIHYQPALLQLEDSLEQTPQKTLHALWLMDTTAFRPEDRQLYHYIAYKGAMLLPDEKNPKPEELKASIGYFREKGTLPGFINSTTTWDRSIPGVLPGCVRATVLQKHASMPDRILVACSRQSWERLTSTASR